MSQHVIALDQGTTSSRTIIFDVNGKVVSLSQHHFAQIYPQPGWVEHDPMTILYTQLESLSEAFRTSGLSAADIAAVGITNQRETTIVWEKETGRPVYNAIVWQCRRTALLCEELRADGWEEKLREKTGSTRISPAQSCAGSSITSPARESAPSAASCSSARWTHGSSGI